MPRTAKLKWRVGAKPPKKSASYSAGKTAKTILSSLTKNTAFKLNTQSFKTIGILGGMGAAASADFYTRVVKLAQQNYKAEQDTDFPAMLIYNLPLSGFDETGFVDPEIVKAQLAAGVKKLEAAGSQFIVIPCNTVYHFYSEMQAAVGIPILNIIEVTAAAVKRAGYHTVGLLNSQSTKQYSLYENAFSAQDIATLSTTDLEQEKVNQVILHVMSGTQGKADIEALQSIISRYAQAGAQALVVGCTELPLAITQADSSLPLFNSSVLLAEAALRYSYQVT